MLIVVVAVAEEDEEDDPTMLSLVFAVAAPRRDAADVAGEG